MLRPVLFALLAGQLACTSSEAIPLIRLDAHGFRFAAEESVTAGVVRLRLVNADPVWHEASVVRFIDSTATIADYVAAVQRGEEYPPFARDVGGVALLAPGDSSDVLLDFASGRYAILCWHQDHLLQGMSTMLRVSPDAHRSAAPPAADSLVLSDAGIPEIAPRSGRHLLYIRNQGPEEHELAILRLEPGKRLEDYLAWRKGGESGPAPGRTIGGTAALAPGGEIRAEVPWERGTYELICLLSDSAGTEHVHRGMRRTITVR